MGLSSVEVVLLVSTGLSLLIVASGHGRVMEPPARNTMWRFGFPTKANYEDSELFCGGIKVSSNNIYHLVIQRKNR